MSFSKMIIIIALKFLIVPSFSFRWTREVNGYDINDHKNGYISTPNYAFPVQAIKICGGPEHKYRVHANGRWLHPVDGCNESDPINGYSGGEEYIVDSFLIYNASYRMSYKLRTWLDPVNGSNALDAANGFSGILGYPFYGIAVDLGVNYSIAYGYPPDKPKPSPIKQNFVDYGTGIKDIPTKFELEHMEKADQFIDLCVISGAANKQQVIDGFYFSVTYTYLDAASGQLREYISEHKNEMLKALSRYYRHNVNIWLTEKEVNGHHFLVDKNGKEVFNSAGLGYRP